MKYINFLMVTSLFFIGIEHTTIAKSSSSSTSSSTSSSSSISKLINDFVKAVNNIKGTCRPTSKDKDKNSQTHSKKHRDQVKNAYQAYRRLYLAAKKSVITAEQNEKVKVAAKKLFECKNIKDMVWEPRLEGEGDKIESKQSV